MSYVYVNGCRDHRIFCEISCAFAGYTAREKLSLERGNHFDNSWVFRVGGGVLHLELSLIYVHTLISSNK
jgi:hypothetical protein